MADEYASEDFSELYALAADITAATENVAPNLGKALGVTSGKIKKAARATVRKRKELKHAAAFIDYEVSGTSGAVSETTSEIGYRKEGAGMLGNLIEYGAPNAKKHVLVKGEDGVITNRPVPGNISQPLAPSHDLGNALLNNEDDFLTGVARAVDDSLKEANL